MNSCCLNFIALISSRLICGQTFWGLNAERLRQSSGKEKGSCLVFPSSTKREFRHFYDVVVQWRLRNVQNSVMHVQSCCFANLNLLPFCRSRCCCRRRCLSSLFLMIRPTSPLFRTFSFILFEIFTPYNVAMTYISRKL